MPRLLSVECVGSCFCLVGPIGKGSHYGGVGEEPFNTYPVCARRARKAARNAQILTHVPVVVCSLCCLLPAVPLRLQAQNKTFEDYYGQVTLEAVEGVEALKATRCGPATHAKQHMHGQMQSVCDSLVSPLHLSIPLPLSVCWLARATPATLCCAVLCLQLQRVFVQWWGQLQRWGQLGCCGRHWHRLRRGRRPHRCSHHLLSDEEEGGVPASPG